MESRDNFNLANQRGQKLQASFPQALKAKYNRATGRIVIHLNSKVDVAFSPGDAEGLENATAEQLDPIEISPSGFGLHFPKLDADLYLPSLLEGFLGSENWMAKRLGEKGGRVRSKAKAIAARKNGRLGGRRKKGIGATAG